MDGKVGKEFKFDAEEKEKQLKRYFMKYFMEGDGHAPEMIKIKVDQSIANQQRQCSCSKGSYDNKGIHIPPCAVNQNKPEKYIKVPMQPEFATREMRDAQLGMSMGLKTKMDTQAINNDLDNILARKIQKIEKNGISPIKTPITEVVEERTSLAENLLKNSVK